MTGAVVVMVIAVAALPPIPQDQAYHDLADGRSFLGVPNFLDVASSFAFAVAGLLGLAWTLRYAGDRSPYALFFAGVTLTAAGSAFYHLEPGDGRLVWDRLPMTIGFTALVAAVLGERVSPRLGRSLLVPLMLAGGASVAWWRWTDDLRAYALVQFGSLLVIVLVPLLYRGRGGGYLGTGLALYALAKAFEMTDRRIFELGQIVSGHTLKHLVAAAGVLCVAAMIRARRG